MNKAITDGVVFQPLPFSSGLSLWSQTDGSPGSPTHAEGPTKLVLSDPDFGGCVELLKSGARLSLLSMIETPVLPGCFLRITARVKAVAGPMPMLRIAGWAGRPGGGAAQGLPNHGPGAALDTYGRVVEVSAIVATTDRLGVDLIWPGASHGHFGIDLTGPEGGLVRVDDIKIEDVTGLFLRDLISVVDVRDFGAKGDGVTDDTAAFQAADRAARGRKILVPPGLFHIADDLRLSHRLQAEGQLLQTPGSALILAPGANYPAYLAAFGDPQIALRKAVQACLASNHMRQVDLCGHRVVLSAPLQVAGGPNGHMRLCNGTIEAAPGPDWQPQEVNSTAHYAITDQLHLTDLDQVEAIKVGAQVTGTGVGPEVYVTRVDQAARTVELSQPLYDAVGRQEFTFTRRAYLLDFVPIRGEGQIELHDVQINGADCANGVLLMCPTQRLEISGCDFANITARGVTAPNVAGGVVMDACRMAGRGIGLTAGDATRIRRAEIDGFDTSAVLIGQGHQIADTQFRDGDLVVSGVSQRSTIGGTQFEDARLIWMNAHEVTTGLSNAPSFGDLALSHCLFQTKAEGTQPPFVILKPYGPGHYLNSLSVVGTQFRALGGWAERTVGVDHSLATVDLDRADAIMALGCMERGVSHPLTQLAVPQK